MTEHQTSLSVRDDRPLIGVITRENGRDITRYFTDDDEADAATAPAGVQRALSLMGAWSDMDWEEAVAELDRIRHESQPTPPIDL
jgi:hypothetical protein